MYRVATSKIHGKGLFASRPIRASEIIGTLEGEVTRKDGPHVLWLSETKGFRVSCDLRFINHSKQPNVAYYDDRSVVALCDIDEGEELTHDYGEDWVHDYPA